MKIIKYTCMMGLLSTLPLMAYAHDNDNDNAQVSSASATDEAISKKVKEKLHQEPTLKNTHISVTTHKGEVSLSGTLQTEDQFDAAKKAAESVDEVKDVNTSKLIEKESGHPMADSMITTKVKALFIKEKLFNNNTAPDMSISVETKDGVVFLSGTTEKQDQIDNAIRLAKSVKDVRDVHSTVVVENSKK